MRVRACAVRVCVLGPLAAVGCVEEGERLAPEGVEAAIEARIAGVLERATDRFAAAADSIYQNLRPVPLLTPGEEAALRRYLNAAHLARARRLGERPANAAERRALRRAGRLVRLEDSTEHWVTRELDEESSLVTPDTRAMLEELGERFQERLDELELPPFRFVISSALRTAEEQAALRRRNPNAAVGVSTHEFGTTVDIAYDSWAAPAEPVVEIEEDVPGRLERHLRRVRTAMIERVAMQKSRELQQIMGDVLRGMQADGMVLVILERQQPVYHLTVAQRFR